MTKTKAIRVARRLETAITSFDESMRMWHQRSRCLTRSELKLAVTARALRLMGRDEEADEVDHFIHVDNVIGMTPSQIINSLRRG